MTVSNNAPENFLGFDAINTVGHRWEEKVGIGHDGLGGIEVNGAQSDVSGKEG